MPKKTTLSFAGIARSFACAGKGLALFFREEKNARIHLCAMLCAVVAGLFLRISRLEWIAVALASGLVFCLEIVNTSIEALSDAVCPEWSAKIGKVKDLAAAAVLVAAIVAAAVGFIVFIPKIMELPC